MKVYTEMLFNNRYHVQGRVIGSNKYEQLYYLDVHGDHELNDKKIYGKKALGKFAMVSFKLILKFVKDIYAILLVHEIYSFKYLSLDYIFKTPDVFCKCFKLFK